MNCILLSAADIHVPYADITDAKQIQHITTVLGLRPGDSLKIGEIGGHLGRATIAHIAPQCIRLDNVILDTPPPSKLDVTVILALPRPKVLRRLIMDMSAIGVRDIVLVNSYRTQKSYWQSPMLDRLDAFVFEGLQQGVDTIAPRISLKKRFKPFVEDELAALITTPGIVAHPYSGLSFAAYHHAYGLDSLKAAEAIPNLVDTSPRSASSLPSVVCIGSEGGWIDYEVELLCQQGCIGVNFGPRILRTEAAVSMILGHWLLSAVAPSGSF